MPGRLIALLLCLLLPLQAVAEERPRAGLLWNRSGLPATFPLQVKTLPGKDYVVFLTRPETGQPVMAGYIRGGQFFRLLVPPGTWQLNFAHGRTWQGEEALFGDETGWTATEEPLEFRIIGTSRRRGHLITLIERNGTMKIVDAIPQQWCQTAWWSSELRDFPEEPPSPDPETLRRLFGVAPKTGLDASPRLRYLDLELQNYTRLCT
ncbi:hypothetical protein [Paracoccus marinaquae]|uniref:Uncharacterized protein n=1 Tax=Paracoccus marinaquae TaxID=2841926 RepID=A0ABS6ANG4_9RHOB|nr:hypothetical protein [Paracoccus marinaquae]MBU3030981.1 hypothetical protein [Paracoccus marinaquae]